MIKIKKRGFSLIELLVAVAIMSILAGISIPFYNSYKKSGRIAALKADLISLQKGWVIFGSDSDSYCKSSDGTDASIQEVGLATLLNSKNYGYDAAFHPNFIGFGTATTGATGCLGTAAADLVLAHGGDSTKKAIAIGIGAKGSSTVDKDEDCELEEDEFVMGALARVYANEYQPLRITESGFLTTKCINDGSKWDGDTACTTPGTKPATVGTHACQSPTS